MLKETKTDETIVFLPHFHHGRGAGPAPPPLATAMLRGAGPE